MNKGIATLSAIVLAVLAIAMSVFNYATKEKVAWIDVVKVFQDFECTKDLQKKLINAQQARKNVLDSLEYQLKVLARKIEAEKGKSKEDIQVFELKRNDFIKMKQQMEEDNANTQRKYDEQIYTQLNQYMKEYGKEKGYAYIHGANGSGSIVYSTEASDITNDMIIYINEKYKGK